MGLQVEGRRWSQEAVQGYTYCKGVFTKERLYFDEIFSHVVKMTSIRTIFSLVAVEDFHIE